MLKKALLICLICLLPLASFAEESNEAAEIIALEIRNLSTSVDRLTQLLYNQNQQKEQDAVLRKLDIAVAYLNFRSRRIEMLERDVQRSRSAQTRFEDVIRQWEKRVEDLEDEAIIDPEKKRQNAEAKEEATSQLTMLKQRMDRVNTEILDYETRISDLQNQLDSVESFVEKHLEL